MNKTLRNKALRDINRLITATINGEDWCAPDGNFAIAYPIYEGYKIKKSQRNPYITHKPDLTPIVEADYTYIEADVIDLLPTGIQGTRLNDIYRITSSNNYWDVNADYYNLIKNIYPNHTVYVDESGHNATPIKIKQDNTLVALLMPLRR